MTVTPKKLAANRANAKKSTGPRTADGKRRCSKNAVTHGLFCNDTVLPGEDAEVFEQFRHAVLLKLSPQDIVELMIVDRIVIAQWKLRRLNSVEASAHIGVAQHRIEAAREVLHDERMRVAGDDEEIDASLDMRERLLDAEERDLNVTNDIAVSVINNDGVLERLSRYEQRLELSIHRNLRQLEKLRKQTQGKREDGGVPSIARCPFLPNEAYEFQSTPVRRCCQSDENRPKCPESNAAVPSAIINGMSQDSPQPSSVDRLAIPVSDTDHAMGPARAPVTLVEYGDYECPSCLNAFPWDPLESTCRHASLSIL